MFPPASLLVEDEGQKQELLKQKGQKQDLMTEAVDQKAVQAAQTFVMIALLLALKSGVLIA